MTACLPTRYTRLRRPRKPLASLRTLLLRTRAFGLRFTLGMVGSSSVRHHGTDCFYIGLVHISRATESTLSVLALFGQDMTFKCLATLDTAAFTNAKAVCRACARLPLRSCHVKRHGLSH